MLLIDCESMRWMPLTVVDMARSLMNTTRRSMSSADRPGQFHTTITTGMSMAGRMSVFIRPVESTPKMAISEQRTATVYGRRRARRTIHMRSRLLVQGAAAFDAALAVRMQAQTPAARFLPDAKRGLRGRHAPTGLRHRRRVQREPAPPAAVPAGTRLPGPAAPGIDPRGGHPALLPLPQP